METLSYKIESFEGPMDLLLHLISKHKVRIEDVPIMDLINQYLDYMKKLKEENLEVASEFLEMAARLVYIKTVSLLPVHEEADRLADELREIYGEPPQEVKNLLEIALIKRLASKAGFERVRVDKKGAELDFADKKYLDNPALFAEMERRKNTCRLDASKKLSVQIGFDGKNASANLHSLENFLLALS